MKLLQLTGYKDGNPIDCFVTWPINGTPTFTFGATDHTVAGNVALSSRQENTWVFLLMASAEGNSYGYASFRKDSDYLFSMTCERGYSDKGIVNNGSSERKSLRRKFQLGLLPGGHL